MAIGSAMDADPTPVSAHAGHCNAPPPADLSSDTLRLRRVGGDFAEPIFVTGAPRDRRRLFVVERAGRIRVVVAGRKLREPFLDLSSEIQILPEDSEQGLFSMAFAPDYQTTGLFYVFFSDENGHYRVQEFRRSRRSANRANLRSRRPLIFIEHRYKYKYHYGGQLQFGPDGFLWIALGDGGEGTPSQDLGDLRGKILRIDPRRTPRRRYSAPPSNPFIGRDGARPEIYLYGLRNPYRFSFDRQTGDLIIGDVGDHEAEELDFVRRRPAAMAPRGGFNFGWPHFEGNFPVGEHQPRLRRYRPPVLELQHPTHHALTGGYVVRDRALGGLYGRYVYGDFCDGTIRSVRLRHEEATGNRKLGLTLPWLSSFGEDTRGRLYATSLFGGVYRLQSTP
jgi:glucose/arabinose dehydrogenase